MLFSMRLHIFPVGIERRRFRVQMAEANPGRTSTQVQLREA